MRFDWNLAFSEKSDFRNCKVFMECQRNNVGNFTSQQFALLETENHALYLQKMYRILRGYNLWHELRDDDDDDAGEEPGLQEGGLEPHWRREQEPFSVLQVNRCQFSREENKKHDENLSPHQKSFHVVAWRIEKEKQEKRSSGFFTSNEFFRVVVSVTGHVETYIYHSLIWMKSEALAFSHQTSFLGLSFQWPDM